MRPLTEQHPQITAVLDLVFAERLRQEQLREAGKFLWTCADPKPPKAEKLSVLAEEFGEVAREVTEIIIARSKLDALPSFDGASDDVISKADLLMAQLESHIRKLKTELIQTAAVACAFAESLP